MGCREEILAVIPDIVTAEGTFTLDAVLRAMDRGGSRYDHPTIRAEVTSRMCVNAPKNHATKHDDFFRVGRGQYRLARPGDSTPGTPSVEPADPAKVEVLDEIPGGDSSVQRRAEGVLLGLLGQQLSIDVQPTRLHLPDGSYVDADGYCAEPQVMVEAWAHQGPPKSAQRNKVLADALKLAHVTTVLDGHWRKILLFSDPEAARQFLGKSWYAGALRTLGIEVFTVPIEDALRAEILAAQERQFR